MLEQTIAIDLHYGPALSWAVICHLRLVINSWTEEPETTRLGGIGLALRALQAVESGPCILVNAAQELGYFGEDFGATIGLIERALALNPSLARGWNLSGLLRVWADQLKLAIDHLETSLPLRPRERIAVLLSVMGQAYFFKRQFEEAEAKLLLSIQDHLGSPPAFRALAACYAHMERLDEARAIVAHLRAITPLAVPSVAHLRNPEDRELLLWGLRRAAEQAV